MSERVNQPRLESSQTWTNLKFGYRFFSLKNGELDTPSLKSFVGKFNHSTPFKTIISIDRGIFFSGVE